jgi:hypothetical protein
LTTDEVWEALSRLYLWKVSLLISLLGKITITDNMTATFVRLFDLESVELFLNQHGSDVLVTAEVMKAALENADSSKEVTLLLFNRYEREAYEALMLLGEEGRITLERKGHLFRVMSSAGWIFFLLKAASSLPQGENVAGEADEVGNVKDAEVDDEVKEVHDEVHAEVDEVYEMESVTSTPSSPHSQIEGLVTPDSSQNLHASIPDHTDVPTRSSSRVSPQSVQRMYRSMRTGLSILPWIETPILPGHQRIYWRDVSTYLGLLFTSFRISDDN